MGDGHLLHSGVAAEQCAPARREEVDVGEVRILGSKSNLLQALIAGAAETKLGAVPSLVPKWRARQDSNLRPPA